MNNNSNRTIADYFPKKRNENSASASVGKITNNQPYNTNPNQISDRTTNFSNQPNNNNNINNPFTANNSNNAFTSENNSIINNPLLKPISNASNVINPFVTASSLSNINNNDFANKTQINNSFSVLNNNINNNQNSNLNNAGNICGFNNTANVNNSNNNYNNNNFNSYLNANNNTNHNYKITNGLAPAPINNNNSNTHLNPFTSNSNPFTINNANRNLLNNNSNNANNLNSNANTNGYNTPPVNSNSFGMNNNNLNNNNNFNNNTNNKFNNNPYSLNSNSNLSFNNTNPIQIQANISNTSSNPFTKPAALNNFNNNNSLIGNNINQNNSINQIYSNNNNNITNNGFINQNNSNSNLAQFSFNKNNYNTNNNSSAVLTNVPSNFNMQQQQPQSLINQQMQEINTIDLNEYLNNFTKEDKEAYDLLNNFIAKNGSLYSQTLNKSKIEENLKETKYTTLNHMASYYSKSCDPALIRYIDYKMRQNKPVNRKNFFIERKYQLTKNPILPTSSNNNNNNFQGLANSGTNLNSNFNSYINNNNNLIGSNFNNNFNSNNANNNLNGLNANNLFGNVNNNNNNNNNNNINTNFNSNKFQSNNFSGFNSNNINTTNGIPNNPFSMNGNSNNVGNFNLNGIQGNNSFNGNSLISPVNNNNGINNLLNNNTNNQFSINRNLNTLCNNDLNNQIMNNNFNNNLVNNNNQNINQNALNNNNNFFNNLLPNLQNLQNNNNNNAPKDYDYFGGDNSNNANNNFNQIHHQQNFNFNQGFNSNYGFNANNINNNLQNPLNNENNNIGFTNNATTGFAVNSFTNNQFPNNNNINSNNPFATNNFNNNNYFNNTNNKNGFFPQIQINSNLGPNNPQIFNNNNNNNFNSNGFNNSTTTYAFTNQAFNASGFNPNNFANTNNNSLLQTNDAYFNSNFLYQSFANQEAYKQMLLNQKLQEIKKNPYGSLSNEADVNKFLETFEKQDDEKLHEKIKQKEKRLFEENEKIKKDLNAKIDEFLAEDEFDNLFSASAADKKSRNEFIAKVNLLNSKSLRGSASYSNNNFNNFNNFNFQKKSIFENERNLNSTTNREPAAYKNPERAATIVNNNYNSYYNSSNNPFFYKNSNIELLSQSQNKFKQFQNNNAFPNYNNNAKIYSNYLRSGTYNNPLNYSNVHNNNINYNNISRRGIREEPNFEAFLNKNASSNSNSNKFQINEFISNNERLKKANLQRSEMKDPEYINRIEHLKRINDFMISEEKKIRERSNQKFAASQFKNPFAVYQGNTSAAGNIAANADFSSFNRRKNNLSSSNGNIRLNAELGGKRNKGDMRPVKEEQNEDASELITYEDIFLKKSEKNEDCDVKKLKFIFKDTAINQTAKFEISINLNITGTELTKIVFDHLLNKNHIPESLGFTYQNILVNTNVGLITSYKQLKSNSYINENIELLVLFTEPNQEENYSPDFRKAENRFYMRKNTEDSNAFNNNNNNNKKDNLDLSSINSKGEMFSNLEYSETKNLIKDVMHLENINNNNNYFNENKENFKNGKTALKNSENYENDSFNEYLFRKQLFKEAKGHFPKTMKYQTIPTLLELKNYSYEDLRKVENFTVYNKHGKITFKGFSDVTFLDLDKIIKINPMEVSVYDEFDFPKLNEELNKPAIIEIYDYHMAREKDGKKGFSISEDIIEEHRLKIQESLKAKDGELIEFDLEKKLLKFEVAFLWKSA